MREDAQLRQAVGRSRPWRALQFVLPHLWPAGRPGLRARVIVALTLLAAAKVINVAVPFLYKAAIDALDGKQGVLLALPVLAILAYGGARVAAQALGELRDAVFAKVAQAAVRSIGLSIFRHLHALSLRFHLERQTGGLSRAIERGTAGIQFVLAFTLFNILPTLLEIGLVCGILLVRYNAGFALITFATIFGYIGYTMSVTEWRTKHRREMNQRDQEANTRAIDSLLNYETVKYFGNEEHEANRYDRALARYEQAAVKNQTSLSALNIGQGAIIAAGLISVMLLAGRGVVRGELTLGDFVLVNTFLIQLYLPLNFLGFVYREMKQSLTDMERMFTLLDVAQEVRDVPGAAMLSAGPGEVRFEGVSFGYDQRRPILDNVSFVLPAGRTLAIVGPSGAGKSTIARLLFRFYDPTGGRIQIDGQDIARVTQSSLRAAIGVVPQDTVLFNDSIRYNIRYGRPGASDAEVEAAARLARIDGFVAALPDGWETRVGERGLKLSGGEKQRVAIARTILKAPRILLFDEATSALDTGTEQEIQASLAEVSANRTTLIIAHRLSTVVGADEIVVLQAGRVAERGNHRELLAKGGLYSQMWLMQQADEDEAAQGLREPEVTAPDIRLG